MIERIAYSLGRNDEEPNIALAELLCETNDIEGIAEIAGRIHDKNKQIASDCIKVLYEIAERKPQLVSGYAYDFIQMLKSGNNRLIWGGMTALSRIADFCAEEIYRHKELVNEAFENGSVITKDTGVSVFAQLAKVSKYEQEMTEVLLNHLKTCRPKDIAQHAERASVCFNLRNGEGFKTVLQSRMEELSASQQSRVRKVLEQL